MVEVRWRDATAYNGWMTGGEARRAGAAQCLSIGYLVRRSKRRLTLVQTQSVGSMTFEDRINGLFVIPRAWVSRVRRLR